MVKVYQLNAFAAAPKGGNPAGVCLEEGLSHEQMQTIARKVGLSETAFLTEEREKYHVKFFTPRKEIDVCGHATIATFSLLAQQGLKQGTYTMITKAGEIRIDLEDELVWMHQGAPRFLGWAYSRKEDIATALNLDTSKIDDGLSCEVVSTGVPTLLVPVKTLEDLLKIKPNLRAVEKLTAEYGNCLMYVYTTQTECEGNTAHARMFAPGYGIPEESATGMAAGALACSIYRAGKASQEIVIEQGSSLKKPSEIRVRLKVTEPKRISDVIIGGKAHIVKTIEMAEH